MHKVPKLTEVLILAYEAQRGDLAWVMIRSLHAMGFSRHIGSYRCQLFDPLIRDSQRSKANVLYEDIIGTRVLAI